MAIFSDCYFTHFNHQILPVLTVILVVTFTLFLSTHLININEFNINGNQPSFWRLLLSTTWQGVYVSSVRNLVFHRQNLSSQSPVLCMLIVGGSSLPPNLGSFAQVCLSIRIRSAGVGSFSSRWSHMHRTYVPRLVGYCCLRQRRHCCFLNPSVETLS